MATFIEAHDSSGALLATLSCSTFLLLEFPFEVGIARRLRGAFVDEGLLSPQEAGAAVFQVCVPSRSCAHASVTNECRWGSVDA